MAVKVMVAPAIAKGELTKKPDAHKTPAKKPVEPRPKRRKSAVYDAEGNEVLITLICLKCQKIRPLSQFGLRRMADAYLKFFQQHPEYYRLLMAFDRDQFLRAAIDPEVYQEVHTRSLNGIEWLERAVKQAQTEGLITVENPREAAAARPSDNSA